MRMTGNGKAIRHGEFPVLAEGRLMVFEWPLTSTPLRPFVNGQMTSFWLACLK